MDTDTGKLPLRSPAHIQKVLRRLRPDDLPVVVPVHVRHRVRLLVIRSEFCKYLIPTHSHTDRDPELALYLAVDFLCNRNSVSPDPDAVRHVEPALIQAEGLDLVRIMRINLPHIAGESQILVIIRRDDHKARAGLPGFPEGGPGLHSPPLCYIVGCQYNAVPFLGISAHREGLTVVFRPVQHLDGGIEAVGIGVENHAVHECLLYSV